MARDEFENQEENSCQTHQVYEWENQNFPDCYGSYMTLEMAQDYVSMIWKDLGLKLRRPRVTDGRGSLDARAQYFRIQLPRWSRNFSVLTHELAHSITALIDPQDNVDHGGIYLHVYFTLMARYQGKKYSELVKKAEDFGLKVHRVKLASRLKPYLKKK